MHRHTHRCIETYIWQFAGAVSQPCAYSKTMAISLLIEKTINYTWSWATDLIFCHFTTGKAHGITGVKCWRSLIKRGRLLSARACLLKDRTYCNTDATAFSCATGLCEKHYSKTLLRTCKLEFISSVTCQQQFFTFIFLCADCLSTDFLCRHIRCAPPPSNSTISLAELHRVLDQNGLRPFTAKALSLIIRN